MLLCSQSTIIIIIHICLTVSTNFSNSSHEIYTITTFDNSTNDIDCTLPNCLIQCKTQDSCNGIRINAININNLEISCDEYNSCNNIEVNTNNHTNAYIKCFYAHSCPRSTISTINSYLQLECDQQDSCQDTTIIINKPLENAVTISCNFDDSCEDLEIQLLSSISPISSHLNWLNISAHDNSFHVLILCDVNSNTTLQLDESNNIQCTDNICCPTNYQTVPNTTSFYSRSTNTKLTTIFISTVIDSNRIIVLEYFVEYLVPSFYCCLLYTILVSIWATIYFCCNTFPATIKCKSVKHLNNVYNNNNTVNNNNIEQKEPEQKEPEEGHESFIKSAMNTVIKNSSCCRKSGYFMDALNITTDIVLLIAIILNTSKAYDKQLWSIFKYVSIGAAVFGLLLYMLKFGLLKKFYPYIFLWRVKIELEQNKQPMNEEERVRKWDYIDSKNKKISKFLGYLVMYDLFSAALQDSLQAIVILYIFSDLKKGDNNVKIHGSEWKEWTYFEWILRVKLLFCIIFMMYKLFNALLVECKCHSDIIKNKTTFKPKYIDNDSDNDIQTEMEEELIQYQNMNTPKSNFKHIKKSQKEIHDGYTQLVSDTPMTPVSLQNPYENIEIEMQSMATKPKPKQIESIHYEEDDLKLMHNIPEILAVGWVKVSTSEGKTYYQNNVTKKTQWNKPVERIMEQQPEKHVVENPTENVVKKQIIIEENKDEQKDNDECKENDESNENVFSDVFVDMKKAKKNMGNVLGDEFESKWKENIVELVDENQQELRTEAMKTVMFGVVDSLFGNIETGYGAKQFFKAVQIMTTVAHENDDNKKEEIEKESDKLENNEEIELQNELNKINTEEDIKIINESVAVHMDNDENNNIVMIDDIQNNDDETLHDDLNENNSETVEINEQKMIVKSNEDETTNLLYTVNNNNNNNNKVLEVETNVKTNLLEDNNKLIDEQLEVSISKSSEYMDENNNIVMTDNIQNNDDEILHDDLNENNSKIIEIDEQKMIVESVKSNEDETILYTVNNNNNNETNVGTILLEDDNKLIDEQLQVSISKSSEYMDDKQIEEIENNNNIEVNNEINDTNSDMLLLASTDNNEENITVINNEDIKEKEIEKDNTDYDGQNNIINVDNINKSNDEIKIEIEEYNFGGDETNKEIEDIIVMNKDETDDVGISLIQSNDDNELNAANIISALNNNDNEMNEKEKIEIDNVDNNIVMSVLESTVKKQENKIINDSLDFETDEIEFAC